MSYLKLAMEAEARLLASPAAPPTSPPSERAPYEIDERNETSPVAPTETIPAPVALRRIYREWFDLTVAEADGRRAGQGKAQALYQQMIRRRDDTGTLFADAIFADEIRRFRVATKRCGLCGGPLHAQD
jgi:hypothetical protein